MEAVGIITTTAIEFSLSGSSPYTSTDNIHKNDIIQKHSTNITKHSKYKYTYYQNTHTLHNTHTHTHTYITIQVKTTTVQDTQHMK